MTRKVLSVTYRYIYHCKVLISPPAVVGITTVVRFTTYRCLGFWRNILLQNIPGRPFVSFSLRPASVGTPTHAYRRATAVRTAVVGVLDSVDGKPRHYCTQQSRLFKNHCEAAIL